MTLDKFIDDMLKRVSDLMEVPDDYNIRFAYTDLYDCYWYCLVAAANFCEIDKSKLNYANLRQSWTEIRERLETVVKAKAFDKWNQIVNEISGFRTTFAHNLTRKHPTPHQISKWANEINPFLDWLPEKIITYTESLPSRRAAISFNEAIQKYIWDAEYISLEIGGDTTPRIVKDNYLFAELFKFQDLKKKIAEVRKILSNLTNITELSQSEFEKIIKLIRYVSLLEGSHHTSLAMNKCPICDGTIGQSSRSYGGTEWDPEPSGAVYRVGCDTCDYTLHEDSISF